MAAPLVGVALVSLLCATGCGGSASTPAAGSGSATTSSGTSSPAPSPAPAVPRPRLGSRVATWAALRASGRYRGLQVSSGRVVGFTRVYAPASSQVPAVDNLESSVLPPDATVVDQGVLSNCEVLVFRLPKSHPLAHLGREFGLRLYSGSGDSAFNPRHVVRAVVSANTLLVS